MSSNSEQSASIVRGRRQERCGESVVLLVVLLVLLTLKLNAPALATGLGLRARAGGTERELTRERERERERLYSKNYSLNQQSCTMSQRY